MKHLVVGNLYRIVSSQTIHNEIYLFKSFETTTAQDLWLKSYICLFLNYKHPNPYNKFENFYKVLYKNLIYYIIPKAVEITEV